eukprot:GFUD01045747.1.p1 GENE.GFUD01045747.1~~GFUD01045747.1.p1  ORF type:complete len:108 (-),score=29.64 GFUD01045747.1:298-621(-)
MERSTSRAMSCYPELMLGNKMSRFPQRVITTRTQDKRREGDLENRKYALPHQTGSLLHTSWYITDRGDKVWIRFDASRPCYQFSTTETRFFKPKLHRILPDPYQKRK